MIAAQMDSFFMFVLQECSDESEWLKRQGREIDRHIESKPDLCQGWRSIGGRRGTPQTRRSVEMRGSATFPRIRSADIPSSGPDAGEEEVGGGINGGEKILPSRIIEMRLHEGRKAAWAWR
jgi:hypothetical protein